MNQFTANFGYGKQTLVRDTTRVVVSSAHALFGSLATMASGQERLSADYSVFHVRDCEPPSILNERDPEHVSTYCYTMLGETRQVYPTGVITVLAATEAVLDGIVARYRLRKGPVGPGLGRYATAFRSQLQVTKDTPGDVIEVATWIEQEFVRPDAVLCVTCDFHSPMKTGV